MPYLLGYACNFRSSYPLRVVETALARTKFPGERRYLHGVRDSQPALRIGSVSEMSGYAPDWFGSTGSAKRSFFRPTISHAMPLPRRSFIISVERRTTGCHHVRHGMVVGKELLAAAGEACDTQAPRDFLLTPPQPVRRRRIWLHFDQAFSLTPPRIGVGASRYRHHLAGIERQESPPRTCSQ